MIEKPLVSVLMTSYNREDYIAEAIESVLSSTYENYELIIVDDCSKDNTVAVAEKYAAKDTRIKVYINKQNLGDYVNRNKAAGYANGKYIKYWDSDDIMYPHCLDVMVRCMEQFPGAGFGLIKPHMHPYNTPYPFVIEKPFEVYVTQHNLFSNSPGSAIIVREVFNKLGGFSGKRYIGDFEFWLKISQQYAMVVIPGFLGWDRTHDNQERNFDAFSYEKMTIDALAAAFNGSALPHIAQLKSAYLSVRKKILYRIVLKSMLKFDVQALVMKYKVLSYLSKQVK